jgi:predicted ATPase
MMTIHLREVRINRPEVQMTGFPFNVPIVQTMDVIPLAGPVTIFVGENGSGKSTLLEAIARKAEMITVGAEEIHRDPTLNPVQPLVE